MNQYFIPALISIILSALIFFFILPRLSPYILGALSVLMLALGIWQHYSMFPYEYRTSIVSELLQQYAGFIIIALVILASVTGILVVHGTNLPEVSEVIPEIPAMPNLMPGNNSKNNSAKNAFNFGGNETKANGANSGILGAVTNAYNSATNAVSNAVTNVVTNAKNGIVNAGKNNSKKNNLASPSFKVV
jgi:hypothetical protein